MAARLSVLPGRRTRHLRAALQTLVHADPAVTRSELEERFLALVRDAGLPEPEVNAEVGPYEIDFLWRAQRLAVELDGWSFHSDRAAFEDDRRRDADLVARGFRVIRITWRELENNAVAVPARIAAALAASRP
jgi:very-short-patch-repair endonuclease